MTKIKYHFFGKECLVDRRLSDYSNLEINLKKIGFNHQYNPLFVDQIHSDQLVVIDDIKKIYPSNKKPKADAIITNIKNLPIAVFTADCLPILFVDEKNSVIAATHAGWSGARKNIIAASIKEMLKLGAKTQNIKAIIGPCIRQKSYEVSGDFFNDFVSENIANNIYFIASKKAGNFMFDLVSYCKNKIRDKGIIVVEDSEIDTYSNEDKLFSYRRSCHLGEVDCGRNISIIMIS